MQHDVVPLQLAAGERQHFPDGVVDVELREFGPGFLGERPQAADHLAGARSIPHNARERVPRFLEIGLVPVQPAQTSLAIGHDAAQGLIDLMGDGGHQLAHRRQPRDAGEFRLRVSQRLLGVSALGDVHDRADEFEVAGLADVGLTHALQVLDRSVWQNDSILMLEPDSFARGALEILL